MSTNKPLHASFQSESIPQSVSPVDKNTVAVSIYGYSVNVLVDTGASISCASSDLIPKLGIKPDQLHNNHTLDHQDKREDFSISWVKFQNHFLVLQHQTTLTHENYTCGLLTSTM